MNEIIYKIEKDINTIKIIDGKLYFGASDFNVYQRDEKGVFSSVIKHEAQVTALGEFKGNVVSAGLDGRVRFTDGSSFISQMPVIRCMSITSDGELIALGGADGQISVHYSDGRLERHWEGHCEGTVISCIWWNKVLFTASSNSDLKCWNLEKSKSKSLASKSNLHDDSLCGSHGIYCMDIVGNKLACGGGDNKISIWEFNDNDLTGKFELKRLKMLAGHTGPVNCIQFYENGRLLATGSNDKTICIWDSDGHLVRQNQVHSAPVLTLHWAKNGIYSGGSDFLLKYSFFNCTNIEEPAELCCPISSSLMFDCVTAEDGQNYSREAIQNWFSKGGKMSPLTGAVIGPKLIENIDIQQKVHNFVSKK